MSGAALPVDEATRRLVSREGLDQTLFVEAGAGTGKTTQLVERIVNLVVEQGVRLASVAAITFTEAAAGELQSRVRARLEDEVAAPRADAERRARAVQALAEADLAAITTLHGFASRLLGEFAVSAGLPPRVRVLDEVSSQLAHEQRWERFVDRLYDDPGHTALLVRASVLGVPLEPRYPGHTTLKEVAARLAQSWDRLDGLVSAPAPLDAVDFGPLERAVAAVEALPGCCTDAGDLFHRKLVEDLLPEMRAVLAPSDPDARLRRLVAVDRWGVGNGGRDKAWDGGVRAAKAVVVAADDARTDVRGAATDAVLRNLLALIAREVLDSARARRDDGGLEFHDLLVLARRLLRTRAEVRATLHERFTHLLLDEFQDTDPLQVELAILIATSVQGVEPGRWEDLDVEPGRLFFVGDPKQSIYRFRRADIGVFLAARDRFGPGGSWARLTTNFRTIEPVLDWVNSLFGALMAEEVPGGQPRYEPLAPWRRAPEGADHRPVLLGGPHPDPKASAPALREAEADDVARVVASVRDRPQDWPVGDGAGGWRPARLSDVTVLVPTRTSLPYLRTALDRAALPYRLATGTLIYDTQEVRDLLAVVRAVVDPTDELSLVAALRSPLYACSDVDLFTFATAGGRWDLRMPPPADLPDGHPVRGALGHLAGLWRERWWSSPTALLGRVLDDRRASLLAFGEARPAEVWRRLRFLLDQARAFEEAGGGDLRAFAAWAELQSADGARVHEPLLEETDEQAVRILTIHGAKGLEFPITILSGLTTRPGGGGAGVSVLWRDGELPEIRLRRDQATSQHAPRADLEVEMDVYEKLRLLYVAATRARDHLVVSCHHQDGRGELTYAGRVWAHFADRPDLWRQVELPEAAPAAPPPGAAVPPPPPADGVAADDGAERARWLAEREAVLAAHRTPRVVSATTVARDAAASLFSAELHDDDDGGDQPDDGPVITRRRGRAGSAIGRAVHATLQLVDLRAPVELAGQVRRQCDIEAVPEHAELVEAMVRSALAAPVVQAAAAGVHHRELYVAAPAGARVIEGYVDLLAETDDGLVVVDYKTDTVASAADVEAKLDAYELQGASYAVALEEVTGLPVTDCWFVFCRPAGALQVRVRDLPAAKERVRAALGAGPARSQPDGRG